MHLKHLPKGGPLERLLHLARTRPGGGLVVLFTGPGERAKTLAAELLAEALHKGLELVDAGRLAGRYIGETEKNLERALHQAARDDAILFLDAADALFGRHATTADSHDRYADQEVGRLLQRLEDHGGLVILATARPERLHPAWRRRIRHVIDFPGD